MEDEDAVQKQKREEAPAALGIEGQYSPATLPVGATEGGRAAALLCQPALLDNLS
jgi:hypothetical protein